MVSSHAWVAAPKHGLRCTLTSSCSSNKALVSARSHLHSVAFNGWNGVSVKAGAVEGSAQKPVVRRPVPPSALENPIQMALVEAEAEAEAEGVSFDGAIGLGNHRISRATWGRIAVLAGGDMLVLLMFVVIGRLTHGLTVFDRDAFRAADPFIAGWLLGAYFLGGFGPEGQGADGFMKFVFATIKSWAVGIPLGLIIKGVLVGHFLAPAFILVTMGSTVVLLVGWRAAVYTFYLNEEQSRVKKEL